MEAMLIGFLILALYMIFDDNTIRVDWVRVGAFIGFMSLVICLRFGIEDYITRSGVITKTPPFMNIPLYWFPLVFWEDCFYAIPIYFAQQRWSKWVWIPLAVVSSIHFGLGHIYQGVVAVFVTALYPYFISVKYGAKYGFGTVMVCHILYDFFTWMSTYFMINYM